MYVIQTRTAILQTTVTTLSTQHSSHLQTIRQLSTHEIDWLLGLGWVRTWEPGFYAPWGVTADLPGISPDGNLLGREGIAIAALDPDFHITSPITLKVVKANAQSQQPLLMLAGDCVYSPITLKEGQKDAEGMVVAVPWHICGHPNQHQPFVDGSVNLWGHRDVNWRTAMSYDATQALIAAIKQNPTREGVAQALRSKLQIDNWATGEVSFSPSGDRKQLKIQLVKIVKIEPGSRSSYGYDFVPVP